MPAGQGRGKLMGTGKISTGTPTRLRSFDPVQLADLEYRAWVGYYLRKWPQVLRASIGLVRLGFGMDWFRTLHGAWLVLRANQLWAPYPDNHPKRARACMRRFYALVRLTYGEPANPAKAAELEVDWWRVHRELSTIPAALRTSWSNRWSGCTASSTASRKKRSGPPRSTARRRWSCPTSGSPTAVSPTATCCRSSMPRWSGPTPPSSLPSITDRSAAGSRWPRPRPGRRPGPSR